MKRNGGIDFMRSAMMFCIILLHILEGERFWPDYRRLVFVLMVSVDAFVFISGYYSVRFSWGKLARLYGTTAFCLVVLWASRVLPTSASVVEAFKGLWFLHCYAFLMCFAPLINRAFETEVSLLNRLKFFAPILCLVFFWGPLSHMLFFHHFVPEVPGLAARTGLTLVGVYIVARFYRLYETRFDQIPLWAYALLGLMFLSIDAVGMFWFGDNDSPSSVLAALCLFHLFKNMRLPSFLGKMSCFVAPSVFSVYLLHVNDPMMELLRTLASKIEQSIGCALAACAGAALCCFAVSIGIDLARRGLITSCQRALRSSNGDSV